MMCFLKKVHLILKAPPFVSLSSKSLTGFLLKELTKVYILMKNTNTTLVTQRKPSDQKWYLIDAEGKTLGRLAVKIANILRGKNKPTYTAHCDTGDYVVVINAEKIKVTGQKESDKTYATYSGYQSGLHVRTLHELRQKHPELILEYAVRGMMPKNNLARHMLKKLRICVGSNHPYAAQSPIAMEN